VQRSELHPLDGIEAGDEPVSLAHGRNRDRLAVQSDFERCLNGVCEFDTSLIARLCRHRVKVNLESARTFFSRTAASMTEPDILSRKVDELKEWQRVAWRRVADPLVTEFERREIRNHIKESDEHLRYYLGMVSASLRRQSRTVGDAGDSLAKLNSHLDA